MLCPAGFVPRKYSDFSTYQTIRQKIQTFSESDNWKGILKLGYEIERAGFDPIQFPLYNYAYNQLKDYDPKWIKKNVPKNYIKRMAKFGFNF